MSDAFSTIDLIASSAREVENDVLTVHFNAVETADQPIHVQTALNERLADTIAIAKPFEKDSEVELESGRLSVSPTYSKQNKITGYHGTVSLTISGTDTATIAALVGKIKMMTVSGTSNSLSVSKHKALEAELIQSAIAAFREKAKLVAESFGSPSWTLGTISVHASSDMARGANRMVASAAPMRSMSDDSGGGFSVESGKSVANAQVRGTIIMPTLTTDIA